MFKIIFAHLETKILNGRVWKFANDLKIIFPVDPQMTLDLYDLSRYLITLGLRVKSKKTRALKIDNRIEFNYVYFHDDVINDVSEIKIHQEIEDLGITIQCTASAERYIERIVSSAKNRWALINRNILANDIKLKMYIIWIRSILEYAAATSNSLKKWLIQQDRSSAKKSCETI